MKRANLPAGVEPAIRDHQSDQTGGGPSYPIARDVNTMDRAATTGAAVSCSAPAGCWPRRPSI